MGFTSLFFCCIFWHFLTPFSGSSLVFAYVVFILIASQQIFMHKYGYINTYTYFIYVYVYIFYEFFLCCCFLHVVVDFISCKYCNYVCSSLATFLVCFFLYSKPIENLVYGVYWFLYNRKQMTGTPTSYTYVYGCTPYSCL